MVLAQCPIRAETSWQDLPSVIWDIILSSILLTIEDKRRIRLVCKPFRASTSQAIHHLTLEKKQRRFAGERLDLAVSKPFSPLTPFPLLHPPQ